MSKSPLIVANWKSNKTIHEAQEWQTAFRSAHSKPEYSYVVCPPLHLLNTLKPTDQDHYQLGVQDLSPFGAGAYTGEVAAANLEGLNITHAILGHSERRKYLDESSAMVARKVEAAVEAGITPIVCMDKDQIDEQANQISEKNYSKIIVAYEPVHAISTFGGKEDPIEVTLQVVEQMHQVFGSETPILYGGSVKPDNSLVYLNQDAIAGILVGSASLDAAVFAQL